MLAVLSRIPLTMLKSVARGLATASAMAVLFGILSVMASTEVEDTKTSGYLWWRETSENASADSERLAGMLLGIGLFVVAALCITVAFMLVTAHARLKKYPAILKGVESMEVQQIAHITGAAPALIYRDLEALINSDSISDLYIDYSTERVVSKKYVPERSTKAVVTCSGCGGKNELIVGIPRNCSFCGEPLLLSLDPPMGRVW